METAQTYRDRAEQTVRLARAISLRQEQEELMALARLYLAKAESIDSSANRDLSRTRSA